jgi:hypothetical protein
MFKRNLDKTGQRFGRLVVVSYIAGFRNTDGQKTPAKWFCKCDCGNTIECVSGNLTSGNTKSCGCLGDENRKTSTKTHGKRHHPLYAVWRTMRDRCNNPNQKSYFRYGGRGIKVCERWLLSFENFWEDMSSGWGKGLSIERIDNNGPYSPENCIWASRKIQARNRKSSHFINTPDGKMTIAEASERYGIKPRAIWMRISYGWKEEDLLLPVNSAKRHK